MMNRDPMEIELEMVRKYGPKYGYFLGTQPVLTITTSDLIKQVMVKDFHHFVNRRQLGTFHELFNNNLL